jgi:hypothetical protein
MFFVRYKYNFFFGAHASAGWGSWSLVKFYYSFSFSLILLIKQDMVQPSLAMGDLVRLEKVTNVALNNAIGIVICRKM